MEDSKEKKQGAEKRGDRPDEEKTKECVYVYYIYTYMYIYIYRKEGTHQEQQTTQHTHSCTAAKVGWMYLHVTSVFSEEDKTKQQ